jgi:uncharacterized protein (DUF433 family)
MACELIEQIPGRVSGRSAVRGTRILPDAIVDGYDLGETIAELREGFPSLSVTQIELYRVAARDHFHFLRWANPSRLADR